MKDFLKAVVFAGLFAIPLLPLYVENSYFFPFITGKNFAFRIIVEIAFAAWVLLMLYDREYRPKFSWLLAGFGGLLGIMLVANIFGEFPAKSFWSNFERMEGYITLVHVFLYFVVAGSVLSTQKLWSYFLHTSLVVAFFVSLYGLGQYAGLIEGRNRIDSRLGNAAYLAIYMLFHIFFIFWLFVKSKVTLHRVLYGILSLMFIFTLLQTGTRGTTIALVAGITTMALYIALFGRRYKEFRKFALGAFIILLLGAGTFMAVRDTQFVQDQLTLRRIANISMEDLEVRFTIWGMAWEGVQERPVLGWGQGNFNYVFNKEYEPSLYSEEQWFDRVHNIFFDWLIAGGVLGAVAYFSILASAIWYLFVRPLLRPEDDSFDVLERGVLLGLLAGYFTHNLVVFDNIISYIFYGTTLALIHARVGLPIPSLQKFSLDTRLINQIIVPIVVLVAGFGVYWLNVPHMTAAGAIIDGFRGQTVDERLEAFERAYDAGSFADQEITEQLVQQAMNAMRQNIPPAEQQKFVEAAEERMLEMIERKPGDARLHVFLSGLYRNTGDLEKAAEQGRIAQELSPEKQSITLERGIIAFQQQDFAQMEELFGRAYELDTSYDRAKSFYAAALFYNDKADEAKALIGDDIDLVATDGFALQAIRQSGDTDFLTRIFERRVELRPNNQQDRASLASIYYDAGETEEAIRVLREAGEDIPEFEATASCFIENIEAGNSPAEGCSS